LIQSGNQIQNP